MSITLRRSSAGDSGGGVPWSFHPLDYPGPVARSPVIVLADEHPRGPAVGAAGADAPGWRVGGIMGSGPTEEEPGAGVTARAGMQAENRIGGLLGAGGRAPGPDGGPVVLPIAPAVPQSRGAARIQRRQLDRLFRRAGAEPMDRRIPVAAVGSNAAPRVLVHKFRRAGVSPVAAYLPCQVAGLRVGHSAHVSARGYIAAAPAAAAARAQVMLVMLTAEQVHALDRTEPNYRRVRLDDTVHPVMCDGTAVAGVWIYESMWGVLTLGGETVPLQGQEALHQVLQAWDPVFAHHAGGLGPHQVVERLTDADVQRQLRRAWSDQALSRPSGLALSPR